MDEIWCSLDTTRFPWSSCSASLGSSWDLVGSHCHFEKCLDFFVKSGDAPLRSAAFVHRLCRGEDNEDVKPGEMKRTITFRLSLSDFKSTPVWTVWQFLYMSFVVFLHGQEAISELQIFIATSREWAGEEGCKAFACFRVECVRMDLRGVFGDCSLWLLAIMTKMKKSNAKGLATKASDLMHTPLQNYDELWPLDCPLKHHIPFEIFSRKEPPGDILLSDFQKILLSALKMLHHRKDTIAASSKLVWSLMNRRKLTPLTWRNAGWNAPPRSFYMVVEKKPQRAQQKMC